MTQNRFDQASRYAAKLDPHGFLIWLFAPEPLPLLFFGWLDTRTLPFPGDPDRTCDTVAWLAQPDGSEPWAVPLEFSLEPDATMFGRMLEYLGRLWLERRPPTDQSGRYQVVAAVVNLTGHGQASRDMQLGGGRTCLQVIERDLAGKDATTVLAEIAAGRIARCVLAWVPLMRGGADSAILERWKELAGTEADASRRSDYGGLALVFAEAAGRAQSWKEALKEWNMVESQVVLGWINQGKASGKAEALLRLLQKRFPPGAPADLAADIKACQDPEALSRWFDAALDATALDDFRKSMSA
ncbi:MAG: hypothetical protein JNM56_14905 [Planctomycetia bacterium]|nr:hypothetical protein [Planctomycetia bacterium]